MNIFFNFEYLHRKTIFLSEIFLKKIRAHFNTAILKFRKIDKTVTLFREKNNSIHNIPERNTSIELLKDGNW